MRRKKNKKNAASFRLLELLLESFKELCTTLFNNTSELSVTCADWLLNKSLTQLWAILLQTWPQLAQLLDSSFSSPFLFLFCFIFFPSPLTQWEPGNNSKKFWNKIYCRHIILHSVSSLHYIYATVEFLQYLMLIKYKHWYNRTVSCHMIRDARTQASEKYILILFIEIGKILGRVAPSLCLER